MNYPDIFADVIMQYCNTTTLSNLARTSMMHYSTVKKNPIYREFSRFYNKSHEFRKVCINGCTHLVQVRLIFIKK